LSHSKVTLAEIISHNIETIKDLIKDKSKVGNNHKRIFFSRVCLCLSE